MPDLFIQHQWLPSPILVVEWANPHSLAPKYSGNPCQKSEGYSNNKLEERTTSNQINAMAFGTGCSMGKKGHHGPVSSYFWPHRELKTKQSTSTGKKRLKSKDCHNYDL